MCVKFSSRHLNLDPYPPHSTNIYTCGMTITPRVRSGSDNVSVIPIVRMDGVGKTILAQLVYNKELVTERFDVKAWVCVSQEFDVLRGSLKLFLRQ